MPNFERYHHATILRALHVWFNEDIRVSWRPIESANVSPHRLQDLVFSNIPKKVSFAKFGPIVSHLLEVWKSVETLTKIALKFHTHMPLFNNYALLLGKQPFTIFHKWKDKGIYTLSDLCSDHILCSFENLRQTYNLPANTLFFYFQIRSALNKLEVPWGEVLPTHPIQKLCSSSLKGLVSKLYLYCIKAADKPVMLSLGSGPEPPSRRY